MRHVRTLLVAGALAAATLLAPPGASAAPAATPGVAPGVPAGTGLSPVCAGRLVALGCDVELVTTGGAAPESRLRSSAQPLGWGATQLAQAHQLPEPGDSTATIAIVDVGADPNLATDLATYRAQYGLPSCTSSTGCFQQVDYRGGPALAPATTADFEQVDEEIGFETTLDVDMASAACPGCHLLEVQIPDSALPADPPAGQPVDYDGYADAFGTAVQTAVARGASAISMSYGLPGDAHMISGPLAGELSHQGVAITASSGDSGFEGNAFTWPQSLPTVTAVGGTELVEQSGVYVEGTWAGAGSSCVPGATPPPGQPSEVAGYCGGVRATTDVSAVADNVAVYDTYTPFSHESLGWLVAAGTSAAAPFVAGVYAAAGHLAGVLGPNTLYVAPARAFNDVTSGTTGAVGTSDGSCVTAASVVTKGNQATYPNALCAAHPGWDGPTGLGSPHGLTGF
jgi:subtilase family serine protease